MKRNIGIMGGTFNPIHNGHLLLAKNTCVKFNLDQILVMPSGHPPHKKGQDILDVDHRCQMVRLAIQNEPNLIFSDIEIKRNGYSYTADTLTDIKDIYNRIYFIIGEDSLFNIQTWYHPEITMKLATLVVAKRDDHLSNEFYDQIKYLKDTYNAEIEVLPNFDCPISSSQIRLNVSNGISIKEMVPNAVEDYILDNKLYLNEWDMVEYAFRMKDTI